jgi:putative membrane protein
MDEKPDGEKPTAEDLKLRLQIETALLGWVRISLALMGFGFVVARFGLFLREVAQVGQMKVKVHPGLAAVNTFAGTVLIVLGVAVLLVAVAVHRRLAAAADRGDFEMPLQWSLGVVLSLALAALGVAMAVYLTIVEL